MEKRRKAIVISGFAARLLVMGALVAQFYEAQSLKTHPLDWTFHAWKYLLTLVFVQGLSIITVCIPYIRNLLLGMESGMIQTGHFRLPSRHGTDTEIPFDQSLPAIQGPNCPATPAQASNILLPMMERRVFMSEEESNWGNHTIWKATRNEAYTNL
ncbi:Uu.00g096840.m01.CDS01 [Anthostomella pinea]|uniref:Uu.00g096840.m01.CDS01 n=1 Tax=Anthostomella pinea TaxID=933095 RepID=A0AAI8YEZ0_9PEZI|nr:Uu.00g096840.m01.CDS01 [Anthostomella pinea]